MPSINDEVAAQARDAALADQTLTDSSWAVPTHPPGVPENCFVDRCIAVGLPVLSCLYLWLFRHYTTIDPDEGIMLQGAQRILHGQVLYRDFFSFITPGAYYLLALIFKVFGSSMLVARTMLVVYGSAFTVFTYLLARRVCSRWSALFAAYLVLITCVPWRFMVLHNWDSTLWACAAVYCAVRWVEAVAALYERRLSGNPAVIDRRYRDGNAAITNRNAALTERRYSRYSRGAWGWALGTGSFASLTVLFEQSKGAGLMLGLGLGLAILFWFGRPRLRLSWGQWLAVAAGLVWPFVLTFAYFGAQQALPALTADWSWPLHHYTQANDVPYGYQDWSSSARVGMFHSGPWSVRLITLLTVMPCFIIPALPILAVILLAYWIVRWRRGKLPEDRARYYVLVCGALAGLLPSVLMVRANIIHFVYLIPLFYLPLAWIIDGADIRGSLTHSLRPLIVAGVFMLFSAVGMAFLLRTVSAHSMLETRRGELWAAKPDDVIPYVQAHVPAGSKMLVYPYRPLYYYLTDTFSPTPYEYIQAGMHTEEQGQKAIRALAADRTEVVLFEPGFPQTIPNAWPKTPLRFIANDPMADYILQRYRSCKVLNSAEDDRLVFMVRKDLDCPRY